MLREINLTVSGSGRRPRGVRAFFGLALALGLATAAAYETYDDCKSCHGGFLGSTSTKGTVFPGNNNHEMHRASGNMGTACNLCHSGSSRKPVLIGFSNGTASNPGLGCAGCHVGAGLRRHHVNNGVTECLDCHDPEESPAENVKPPYYGTTDTRVSNPGNPALASKTNENWSVGDFLGLDNDGNNLYDLADYAVGPFRLLTVEPQGNDLRVSWLTAGGRTNTLQVAASLQGGFANLGPKVAFPGVGLVTNTVVDPGGATNLTRFYRVADSVP